MARGGRSGRSGGRSGGRTGGVRSGGRTGARSGARVGGARSYGIGNHGPKFGAKKHTHKPISSFSRNRRNNHHRGHIHYGGGFRTDAPPSLVVPIILGTIFLFMGIGMLIPGLLVGTGALAGIGGFWLAMSFIMFTIAGVLACNRNAKTNETEMVPPTQTNTLQISIQGQPPTQSGIPPYPAQPAEVPYPFQNPEVQGQPQTIPPYATTYPPGQGPNMVPSYSPTQPQYIQQNPYIPPIAQPVEPVENPQPYLQQVPNIPPVAQPVSTSTENSTQPPPYSPPYSPPNGDYAIV